MKKHLTFIITITIICLFGLPLIVMLGYTGQNTKQKAGTDGPTVRVLDKATGKINIIPLEQYLIGVVAAEMPAKFELEALKAQSVAARTYTVKRMLWYGAKPNAEHPNAEVCTDPTHCQAWIDTTEQKNRWGSIKYYINIDRIKQAVRMTRGIVVTYNDALIDPVYHGSCGGKGTENAEDVWSNPIPYLKSVDCSSEYRAQDQKTTVVLEKSSLRKALNPTAVPILTGNSNQWITSVKASARGRIQEAVVGGKRVSGTDLRKILGLSSTFLTWKDNGSNISFTSYGKGHAVGMCQYGANGIALNEKSYLDILTHYYTGVKIKKLNY